MKKFRLLISVFLGFFFFFSGMSTLFAQQEDGDESFVLEEITVTAQKRAENQQKVAIAMEVVTGEDLKQLGNNDIDEILNNISNVLINTSADGLRVSIRGMSNDPAPFNDMQTSKPTVAVNKDGIYTNRNSGNTDLYDVERVEVLFGPQSTLYASASPGGIVNVITSDPKLETYEASGSIEYGNYDQLKTEGSVNAPVSDMMALRGAFSTSVHDGYLSEGGMDEDSKSARVKYLFEPNECFSIVATGEISKSSSQGFTGVKLFVNQDDDTYPDGTKLTDPWTSASDTPELTTAREEKRISAHIEWDLGYVGSLSVIPSYTKATNFSSGTTTMAMGPFVLDMDRTLDGNMDEKGIEGRLTSSEDFPFKWIIGFNTYKSEEEQHSWYYELNDDDPDVLDSNTINMSEQKTTAIFGNLTYPVMDRLRVTAGARMTWDENTTGTLRWSGVGDPNVLEPWSFNTMEYDDPDFKIGFEYDLSDTSMLFADWSSSYRTNGKGPTKVMPPEQLKAYSIGAKNRFFENRLQLNASAYYYDYQNYFTVGDPVWTIVDSNGNGIPDPDETELEHDLGQLTTGDATIYGFDIQMSAIITDRDKLDISLSYVNKEFSDIIFDYYDITNYLGLEDMSYNNYEMANAPDWTANLNYSHNFNLPNGGTLTPRLEYQYQSSYLLTWQADSINLEQDLAGNYYYSKVDRSEVRVQEAHVMGNLSMVYADPDDKWTFTLYVKNLEDYALKRSLQGPGGNELRIGPPRTYGAVLSVRY